MSGALPFGWLGLGLGLGVGVVLGLLGGGGSILALPIFLYVFRVPVKPAVAMSLAVVGASALTGFLSHWRRGNVDLPIALRFGAAAMAGAYVTARVTHLIPAQVQLALFALFAGSAAVLMLRDAARDGIREGPGDAGATPRFTLLLTVQAVAVGALTAVIGAGGGFVIVPALVLLARVPVRAAVGSSLLIIAMNALSAFAGYIGTVPIDWPLVASFTASATVGVALGVRLSRHVPERRIKQGFAVMILVLGAYLVGRSLV